MINKVARVVGIASSIPYPREFCEFWHYPEDSVRSWVISPRGQEPWTLQQCSKQRIFGLAGNEAEQLCKENLGTQIAQLFTAVMNQDVWRSSLVKRMLRLIGG